MVTVVVVVVVDTLFSEVEGLRLIPSLRSRSSPNPPRSNVAEDLNAVSNCSTKLRRSDTPALLKLLNSPVKSNDCFVSFSSESEEHVESTISVPFSVEVGEGKGCWKIGNCILAKTGADVGAGSGSLGGKPGDGSGAVSTRLLCLHEIVPSLSSEKLPDRIFCNSLGISPSLSRG